MKTVAVIRYGMGNVDSVARAVEDCGARAVLTDQRSEIESASAIILPGVGAFADGIRQIRARGLDALLQEQVIDKRIPFLGICLGMQVMARYGMEGGRVGGLGWIDAEAVKLQSVDRSERVPHVGWNEVHPTRPCALFDGIPPEKDFYFVHSFHLVCADPAVVAARTPYCGGFAAAIHRDNLFGVQFHPEKSQKAGMQLLKNFLSC